VLVGKSLKAKHSPLYRRYAELMSWADEKRRLKVRTNADTPSDAQAARAFGAEGIGLCRTEHMFFAEDRIRAVREMILAEDLAGRKKALVKLLPMQRKDFVGIFKAMNGLPVTIRLLDPPLHEFLPTLPAQFKRLSREMKVPAARLVQRAEQLHESNPMLGHRGCRLGITYPEVYEMQAVRSSRRRRNARRSRSDVRPEVMIPLVGTVREFTDLAARVRSIAAEVERKPAARSRTWSGR
jgi:pyruvate,orthophosphate dikinase